MFLILKVLLENYYEISFYEIIEKLKMNDKFVENKANILLSYFHTKADIK